MMMKGLVRKEWLTTKEGSATKEVVDYEGGEGEGVGSKKGG